MPSRRQARTDLLLACVATLALVAATALPPPFPPQRHTLAVQVLLGLWAGARLVVLQWVSQRRWHLSHNTPLSLSSNGLERLYG